MICIIELLKNDRGNENKKKGVCKILEKFGDVDFNNPDKVFEEFEKSLIGVLATTICQFRGV